MPDIQQSQHVPRKQDRIIHVDLSLACGYCTTGRVLVLGDFDYRAPIQAWCDNPICGEKDDDDKGREHLIMVTERGEFLQYGSLPSDPEPVPTASEHIARVRAAVRAKAK